MKNIYIYSLLSMKNILIIGGAGYVGTELINYLNQKKYNITCLDTFGSHHL